MTGALASVAENIQKLTAGLVALGMPGIIAAVAVQGISDLMKITAINSSNNAIATALAVQLITASVLSPALDWAALKRLNQATLYTSGQSKN